MSFMVALRNSKESCKVWRSCVQFELLLTWTLKLDLGIGSFLSCWNFWEYLCWQCFESVYRMFLHASFAGGFVCVTCCFFLLKDLLYCDCQLSWVQCFSRRRFVGGDLRISFQCQGHFLLHSQWWHFWCLETDVSGACWHITLCFCLCHSQYPFVPGLLTSSNVWDWLIFQWTRHNFCRHLHNAGCGFHTLHSAPSPAVFGVKFHIWTLFVSAIIIPCVVNIPKITFCLERWRTLGGPAAGAAAKLLTCLEDTPDMLANYYESCERRPFQSDCRSWVWFCWLLLQGCCWHGRGNHGCWQWHANPCWSRERNKWYALHCKPEIILQDWIPPLMSLRICTRVIHLGKMLKGA